MDTITTQISLADSAAESMSNQLVRARELAIIAANGTMTATDRQNISTELRSEEHTSELQSLMRISYAVFCLKKKKQKKHHNKHDIPNKYQIITKLNKSPLRLLI